MSYPCEAKCGQYFSSIKSMNLHLTSAKSCSWYEKTNLRDLGVNDMEDEVPLIALYLQVNKHVEDWGLEEYDPQQDPDVAMEFGPYGEELQFFPAETKEILDENQPQIAENGILKETTYSRHTVLDGEDDEHITIVDEDAGRIFYKETPPRYTQDREGDVLIEGDREPNPFAPFSSE